MNGPELLNNEEPAIGLSDPTIGEKNIQLPNTEEPLFLQPAILDEILIEEISIDGMCGIY